MPGRKYVSGDYRFGFNGKENDSEWGSQVIQDYGFRIYNPSIGKFLSVDPLRQSYPWYTPYQFAGNKPIIAIDLDGLEEEIAIILDRGSYRSDGKYQIEAGFTTHVDPLIKYGYSVFYAKNGRGVLDVLSESEVPVQKLILLSHGNRYAIVGSGSNNGIYSDEGLDIYAREEAVDHPDRTIREEYDREIYNPRGEEIVREVAKQLINENGAIKVSTIIENIENGNIKFEDNFEIVILGCSTCTKDDNTGIAIELVEKLKEICLDGQTLNFSVIASSNDGHKGLTSPYPSISGDYGPRSERRTDGSWIRFNSDGTTENLGKTLNITGENKPKE